jgi:hypothetical protein
MRLDERLRNRREANEEANEVKDRPHERHGILPVNRNGQTGKSGDGKRQHPAV